MATPTRPLIVPEPFSGEGSWDDWSDHFESAAAVNKWENADKLLWIRARMTGRAQKAFKNLSEEAKSSYDLCKKALRERFEPASKKELYQSEFHTRRRRKTEDWAAFAEDLKTLAERAFPDLQDEAREHLALTHYLGQLENLQVAFGVKQKRPKTVDEAVTATLELESYLIPQRGQIGQVCLETTDQEATTVAAVHPKQDALMEMMKAMMERLEATDSRLERLEAGRRADSGKGAPFRRPGPVPRSPPSRSGAEVKNAGGGTGEQSRPIVCFKCNQEGHVARGCRARSYQQQGN